MGGVRLDRLCSYMALATAFIAGISLQAIYAEYGQTKELQGRERERQREVEFERGM